MDEYLDEEVESLRNALELICRGWDKQVSEVSTPQIASIHILVDFRACK